MNWEDVAGYTARYLVGQRVINILAAIISQYLLLGTLVPNEAFQGTNVPVETSCIPHQPYLVLKKSIKQRATGDAVNSQR